MLLRSIFNAKSSGIIGSVIFTTDADVSGCTRSALFLTQSALHYSSTSSMRRMHNGRHATSHDNFKRTMIILSWKRVSL